MICERCGANVPEPAMFCSATEVLVCQGQPPVAGCGNVLTADERHWYGTCCEACEEAWNDRIETWRRGGQDADLDTMFGAPPNRLQ